MNAHDQIKVIPVETLVEIVRLLTEDRADPQFVRAVAMNLKQIKGDPRLHAAPPLRAP